MCLNKLKRAWMSLNKKPRWAQMILNKRINEFKWTSIGLIELEQAQMSVNESLNGRNSAQMSLNKSKRAWMSLNRFKWAIMSSNKSKWTQISLNEPK